MFNAKLAGHHQIDNSQLRTLAPSVFAGQAHAKVSDRYSFIPTATVVDGLSAEGWAPVWASEQRIRLSDRQGFQKHMIRFARVDDLNRTQQERPELVLVNSHDRSSAYQLHAGIFRFVCSNGMILADSVFAKISIMHVNFEPAKVIEASFGIVHEMPRIADLLEGYKARTLTNLERTAFGEAALMLKYDELEKAPIGADKLLAHRRREDAAPIVRVDGEVSGGWLTLSVADNGIGFDPQYAQRIFRVFERLHGRGTYPGTGIGLALCRKIAERHGGTVVAASAPGEGATFTVTMQTERTQAVAAIPEANGSSASNGSESREESYVAA